MKCGVQRVILYVNITEVYYLASNALSIKQYLPIKY